MRDAFFGMLSSTTTPTFVVVVAVCGRCWRAFDDARENDDDVSRDDTIVVDDDDDVAISSLTDGGPQSNTEDMTSNAIDTATTDNKAMDNPTNHERPMLSNATDHANENAILDLAVPLEPVIRAPFFLLCSCSMMKLTRADSMVGTSMLAKLGSATSGSVSPFLMMNPSRIS